MEKKIWIHSNLEDFNRLVAANAADLLAQAIQEQGYANFLLSGGSTPKGVYQALASDRFRRLVDWSEVHFFWGDERCVPPDDENSNFKMAFEVLLRNVPADPRKTHRIKGELAPNESAEDYRQLLADLAPAGMSWPIFDVALMGLGEDGHTASLFPGARHPDEGIYPVIPVTAQYQDRPAHRVTLTPLALNTSRNVIFLVTGESKALALQKALSDEEDLERIPVQRIRPAAGNIIWHTDSTAAKYIHQD
ncbi:MAG: 6-phosphogluconolactonase [Anaerolineaceae bacterium]